MEKTVFITIIRYASWKTIPGFFSMAFFRLPMWLNKKCQFYKLMGCGKNGTFDIRPDLHQWAILSVHNDACEQLEHTQLLQGLYGKFITWYIGTFAASSYTLCLTPIKSHGTWDQKTPFIPISMDKEDAPLPIAILTRATIRLSRFKAFWKHVEPVASIMHQTEGYLFSVGIGEVPWLKQATFSIWQSSESMRQFAYKDPMHKDVIKKTREERWYTEEMFVRFKIEYTSGNMNGVDPLANKL